MTAQGDFDAASSAHLSAAGLRVEVVNGRQEIRTDPDALVPHGFVAAMARHVFAGGQKGGRTRNDWQAPSLDQEREITRHVNAAYRHLAKVECEEPDDTGELHPVPVACRMAMAWTLMIRGKL